MRLVRPVQVPPQERGELGPPLRPVRHGRQQLEFQDDAGHLQGHRPRKHARGDLLVVVAHLRPGGFGDGHGGQGEVHLGEDLPAADHEAGAAVDRTRGRPEAEGVCGVEG